MFFSLLMYILLEINVKKLALRTASLLMTVDRPIEQFAESVIEISRYNCIEIDKELARDNVADEQGDAMNCQQSKLATVDEEDEEGEEGEEGE